MKTNILTLCDFAKDYNGQLNITGTFNQIRSDVFPTFPVSFYIVCQFILTENIVGDHNVNISVKNKDTGSMLVAPQDFRLSVAKHNEGQNEQNLITNLVLSMDKVVFENPGTFTLKVISDGNSQELDFYVVKV